MKWRRGNTENTKRNVGKKTRHAPQCHRGEAGCQGADERVTGARRPTVAARHVRASPELGLGTEGTSRDLAASKHLGVSFPALSWSPRVSLKSNPVAGMGS